MIFKIRVFRLAVHFMRACKRASEGMDQMSHAYGKAMQRIAVVKWRKWLKLVAKIVALGTTITGAVTAMTSSSSATGIAIGAAGATGGVVATHGIPVKGYEKIKHVSPKINNRAMNVNMQPKMAIGSNKRHTVQKPTATKR